MLPADSEIIRARADLEAMMLPDVCNILSVTVAADTMGGISETWGTAKVNVPCRVDSLTDKTAGREILTSGEISPFHTYVMTLPQSATVTTDSRIEHGDYTYAVKSVTLDRSWSWCKRLMVERL